MWWCCTFRQTPSQCQMDQWSPAPASACPTPHHSRQAESSHLKSHKPGGQPQLLGAVLVYVQIPGDILTRLWILILLHLHRHAGPRTVNQTIRWHLSDRLTLSNALDCCSDVLDRNEKVKTHKVKIVKIGFSFLNLLNFKLCISVSFAQLSSQVACNHAWDYHFLYSYERPYRIEPSQ